MSIPEERMKISLLLKDFYKTNTHHQAGNPISENAKIAISKYWKGRKHTKEHRDKIILKKIGKPNFNCRGSKSHLWRGGKTKDSDKIRKSLEYGIWRRNVFERDNYTCRECNIRGVKLHAHHIKSFADYPELRTVIDNGITLCIKCHRRKHANNHGFIGSTNRFILYTEASND